MEGKPIIEYGTYFHNSDVWDEVVGYCKIARWKDIGEGCGCDKVYVWKVFDRQLYRYIGYRGIIPLLAHYC